MTTSLTPQEQTYQALRRAMLRAQEAGVRIICEAVTVYELDSLIGCCAIHAGHVFADVALGQTPRRLVIRGFDGLPFDQVDAFERAWYDVGARLRDEFRPITATALERELEGT